MLLPFFTGTFIATPSPEKKIAYKPQTAPRPHCLPVCKNRFEKFARIFSRRKKQTTFSDADFLGVLRVKTPQGVLGDNSGIIFSRSPVKHMLWVVIRSTLLRRF